MTREEILKREILGKYKSLRQFATEINIAPSTLTTILNNGIGGTSIDTMLLICEKLNLDINMFREDDFENDFYTPKEKNVINMYRKLNDSGKEKTEDYINDLVSNPNYCANDNVIQITEQPRKEFDFSTAKIAGDDGEFRIIHYTPEQQEEIRKAIEKDPELKKFFGI